MARAKNDTGGSVYHLSERIKFERPLAKSELFDLVRILQDNYGLEIVVSSNHCKEVIVIMLLLDDRGIMTERLFVKFAHGENRTELIHSGIQACVLLENWLRIGK